VFKQKLRKMACDVFAWSYAFAAYSLVGTCVKNFGKWSSLCCFL